VASACSGDAAQRSPAPPAPPGFSLSEHGGRTLDLAAERGRVVVVFFGYTHCPDVCPTTLADFVAVKRRLAQRAGEVRFAFITVDPRRDTPEVARRYAAQFDSTFFGLSSDSVTLAGIQRQFRASAWIGADSTGAVMVAHSASVYVIGRDGSVRDPVRFDVSGRLDALYEVIDHALRD
jgi:protein SCO1/2